MFLVSEPTSENPKTALPTNPPYEVRFSQTTTYLWTNFDVNASESSLKMGWDVEPGPFGFGSAVVLDKGQVRFN